MLYRVTTESGSVYIVDTDKKVAGRMEDGAVPPQVIPADSPYPFPVTGELRPYYAVKGIVVGSQLAIFWTPDKVRLTSPVVKVEDESSQLVEG